MVWPHGAAANLRFRSHRATLSANGEDSMRPLLLTLATLILVILGLAYGPGSLSAARFTPTPASPELLAEFERTDRIVATEARQLHGAEDLEPGPDGRLYASLADGRIMARDANGSWSEIINTGGRPLGLSFAPDSSLFIADAELGLLRFEDGELAQWIDGTPGGDLVFTDDLTVLDDGRIVLTDASLRHRYGHHMTSFLEADQTGRVIIVTAPGQFDVLADDLAFINGVDHDPSTGLVYLNETWSGRVWRLDPDTGDMIVFADGLPGYPDNLEFDASTGLIWSAMPSMRSAELDSLHGRPFVKRLTWRWIQLAGLPELPPRPAMAVAFNRDGELVHAVRGPAEDAEGITTATPWEGRLYTAGLERDGVTIFDLPENE